MTEKIINLENILDKAILSLNTFHNTLITLSSGSIVVTISLLNLKKHVINYDALVASWICFVCVIVFSLIRNLAVGHTFFNLVNAYISHLNNSQPESIHSFDYYHNYSKKWSSVSNVFHYISPIAFALGVVLMTIFGLSIIK